LHAVHFRAAAVGCISALPRAAHAFVDCEGARLLGTRDFAFSVDASMTNANLAGLPRIEMEAVADGILTVAMTILVLKLHVPDLDGLPSPVRE